MRSWPRLVLVVAAATASLGTLGAQAPATPAPRDTDLDRFMAAVLARRDDNWKKLQQYILDERERVQIFGPGGARLYGLVRDYRWFVKDGYFIRSPLAANGVPIGDDERRNEEAAWLRREQRRETRQAERAREKAKEAGEPAPAEPEPPIEGVRRRAAPAVRAQLRPRRLLPEVQVRGRPLRSGRQGDAGRARSAARRVLSGPPVRRRGRRQDPRRNAAPGAPGGAIATTTAPTGSASSAR